MQNALKSCDLIILELFIVVILITLITVYINDLIQSLKAIAGQLAHSFHKIL